MVRLFLCRSIFIFPFWMLPIVFKNGIALVGLQSHLSSGTSWSFVVCFIVSIIVGLILFTSTRSACRIFVVPLKSRKRSSKNLFRNKIAFSLSRFLNYLVNCCHEVGDGLTPHWSPNFLLTVCLMKLKDVVV